MTTPDEDDHDMHSKFMESYNTNLLSDATNVVEELKTARSKKLKKSFEITPTRSQNTIKGEISQCVETFTEVAKTLIGSKSSMTSSDVLHDSVKVVVDILNNIEVVEVASLGKYPDVDLLNKILTGNQKSSPFKMQKS